MTLAKRTGEPLTEDGIAYEDGELMLSDARVLAWRWWGAEGGTPILRLQGMPASRLFRNPDPRIQLDLGVRYLMADRPGYGGSTRLPGRGLAVVADDLGALLDAHGLDRLPVMGTSGGGPHALAFAARHPRRVSAVSVIGGVAPLAAEEVDRLVAANAAGYAAGQKGWQPLYELLVAVRERILGEEGLASVSADAPAGDRALLADPVFQRLTRANIAEALKQGAEGWTDESFAIHGDWDFDPAAVEASVTWWHGDDDMNVPLSAARRVAARLPKVDLRVWHGEGHFASLVHEKEIVQELISRAR